jgi:periplasmic protein TonB
MKAKDSYLELLFENHNKAYGAYELRANYHSRLLKSFGGALLIASLFFLIPFVLTLIFAHPKKVVKPDDGLVYQLEKDFVFDIKPKISPPVSHTIAENSLRIVRNNEAIETREELKKDNTEGTETTTTQTGTSTDNSGGGDANGGHEEILPLPGPVMNVAAVDVAPSFPGGEAAMMKFLYQNLKYPAIARENGISGKIYASFITDENGNVTEVQIKRGLEQSLDAEVVRVINKMPSWTPGIYHGKPVKVIFMLPVTFALK